VYKSYRFAVAAALVILIATVSFKPPVACAIMASAAEAQVCDPLADYALGMEDYPAAVKLHQEVLRKHPGLAVAYYHLGFAYGVLGDHNQELRDYRKAVEFGLSDWALFLNLGRLYLESNHLDQASDAFRLATLLAPYRPETHYNLGLVYERLGRFHKAEQEILLSLRLEPDQTDARNTLGIIYAEERNFARAHEEWADLKRSYPDYTPAISNLAILQQVERQHTSRSIHDAQQVSGFAQMP
jgi:tetratricopeptide (TPR) repeat protein